MYPYLASDPQFSSLFPQGPLSGFCSPVCSSNLLSLSRSCHSGTKTGHTFVHEFKSLGTKTAPMMEVGSVIQISQQPQRPDGRDQNWMVLWKVGVPKTVISCFESLLYLSPFIMFHYLLSLWAWVGRPQREGIEWEWTWRSFLKEVLLKQESSKSRDS